MKWARISVRTSDSALEPVYALAERIGANGVLFEEGPGVVCFLPVDDRLETSLLNLRAALDELRQFGIDPGPAEITITFEDDRDWANAWREHFHPLEITPTLTVVPAWQEYKPRPDERIIRMDPGMAFGTGGHAATRTCLRALERYTPGKNRIADIGCGSGILAVAAALMGARDVLAIDDDPVAVRVANENIALNGVSDRVRIRQGNLLEGVEERFDVIVANILPHVVAAMAESAHACLDSGGLHITSGFTRNTDALVRDRMVSAGFQMEPNLEEDGWLCLVGRR
ncbi:MAG TPA: 50S ribosomal protein L11 methyltransferase [Armatimonadota bacterium]|nr:50S ribosomal protein L11 methyltransferase [Armatimonadota bacterium]